ncbi:extensin-2-like [Stegodyphus dumicola]|uniref:extensin-2-like n=1 Tax=Stegodyphus dumicola TaxID=202533 RepID=UPI0015AA0661|nr:extensin-2-like [Stegodyphus dumicola]
MKIILGIWVVVTSVVSISLAEPKYEPRYLSQEVENSENREYHPHPEPRGYKLYDVYTKPYEPQYQSIEPQYKNTEPTHYQVDSKPAPGSPYPQPNQPLYNQPPQQITSIQKPQVPHADHQRISYSQPPKDVYIQIEQPQATLYHNQGQHEYEPSEISHYQRAPVAAHQGPQELQSIQTAEPKYVQPIERQYVHPDKPKYIPVEEPKHTQVIQPQQPHSPAQPYDPKLPQYFTMYEKRVIQDPTDKYGKGPWRYLTYGHGITYGSKEPGKVFEKGYGYIRALGRDHCKLPEHLCPPKDDKPFEYEGRKEPYFGYRPH